MEFFFDTPSRAYNRRFWRIAGGGCNLKLARLLVIQGFYSSTVKLSLDFHCLFWIFPILPETGKGKFTPIANVI